MLYPTFSNQPCVRTYGLDLHALGCPKFWPKFLREPTHEKKKISLPTSRAHLSSHMLTSPKYRIPAFQPPASCTLHRSPVVLTPTHSDSPPPSPVNANLLRALLPAGDLSPTKYLSSALPSGNLKCAQGCRPQVDAVGGLSSPHPLPPPRRRPQVQHHLPPYPHRWRPQVVPLGFLCTVATPHLSPYLPPHGQIQARLPLMYLLIGVH